MGFKKLLRLMQQEIYNSTVALTVDRGQAQLFSYKVVPPSQAVCPAKGPLRVGWGSAFSHTHQVFKTEVSGMV